MKELKMIDFNQPISEQGIKNLIVRLRASNSPNRVWINSLGVTFEFFLLLVPPCRALASQVWREM
jgi:hypothetical protein